ncbi:hypothetical protein PROFUN_01367, partial [Planoprotostelium fungivorum]
MAGFVWSYIKHRQLHGVRDPETNEQHANNDQLLNDTMKQAIALLFLSLSATSVWAGTCQTGYSWCSGVNKCYDPSQYSCNAVGSLLPLNNAVGSVLTNAAGIVLPLTNAANAATSVVTNVAGAALPLTNAVNAATSILPLTNAANAATSVVTNVVGAVLPLTNAANAATSVVTNAA